MSRAKYFSSVTLVKSNAKALSAEPKVQCALRGGLRYLRIPLLCGTFDAFLCRPIFERVKSAESLSPLAPLTSARNGRLYKGNQENQPDFSTQSFSALTTSFRSRYLYKKRTSVRGLYCITRTNVCQQAVENIHLYFNKF